jgi:predicted branched-subunit amino acid permease
MCGILLYTAWNLGTVAGMLAGSAVPDPAAFGVDAAFPAGLLALLLPGLRRRDARRVALTAAVVALLATRVLPTGLPVLAGLLGLLVAGTPPAPRSADPASGAEQPPREPPADEDEPPAAPPGTGR